MVNHLPVAEVANFLIIAGLALYGLLLFADYHARGRWAKNVTGLLGGLGMLALAVGLLVRPQNAEVLLRLSRTRVSDALIWISSSLLLAAMAAFGVLAYFNPWRLAREKQISAVLEAEPPKSH